MLHNVNDDWYLLDLVDNGSFTPIVPPAAHTSNFISSLEQVGAGHAENCASSILATKNRGSSMDEITSWSWNFGWTMMNPTGESVWWCFLPKKWLPSGGSKVEVFESRPNALGISEAERCALGRCVNFQLGHVVSVRILVVQQTILKPCPGVS